MKRYKREFLYELSKNSLTFSGEISSTTTSVTFLMKNGTTKTGTISASNSYPFYTFA